MSAHRHADSYGHIYRYHPRSDAHSVALCAMVLEDLLEECPTLRAQAERGEVVYGINLRYTWVPTGKTKTLDLALGPPVSPAPQAAVVTEGAEPVVLGSGTSILQVIAAGDPTEILFSCEAKSVMTEHGKSKPRVFDELSSSHEIVHQGRQDAIAAGITVVNIATEFASPLRQRSAHELIVTRHRQPRAAAGMVQHLRGLRIRDNVGEVGFDAYASIVVDCDNVRDVRLWTELPAPQPGEADHYDTFVARAARLYTERFQVIPPRS
jgi:hypothetical protein